MELRMYFFVLYSLSGIQKGIQASHCALEYAHKYGHSSKYKEFFEKHKTMILLNGGTSRDAFLAKEYDSPIEESGSLNVIKESLYQMAVPHAYFREPDLNYAVTAVCVICDERVYNKIEYPDFYFVGEDEARNEAYDEWVESIGGDRNAFLRELLRNKSLA